MEAITKRKLSVEEYHRMAEVGILAPEEKVELIEGEIITMRPIGKEHAAMVRRINQVLHAHLDSKQFIIDQQNPVIIHGHSEPEPDLMVVPFRDDFYAGTGITQDDVLLIIEVSDSTLRKDMSMKLPLYAKADIPEVWIIDLGAKTLHQFTKPGQEKYLKQMSWERSQTLSLTSLGLKINVRDLLG